MSDLDSDLRELLELDDHTRDRVVAICERRSLADRLVALRTMTDGLAHEFRNPLNAAKLQLELLERRLRRAGGDVELSDPVDLAKQELARLAGLIEDFVVFAGPSELELCDHDVVAIGRHVVELELCIATRRGAALTLLPAAPSIVAAVDADKMHHVMRRLVRNALEAVAPGGHVSVAIVDHDHAVRIQVADDGLGISDDHRTRICEPFFTTKNGSVGLGMSIVHSMIELHRGKLDVTTSERGTRFDVLIPRFAAP